MITWVIKKGNDHRLRAGHPWVFSNELSASPKGLPSGSPIKMIDQRGEFLAWGYGNPQSLISFRAVSFDPNETEFLSEERIANKILNAWSMRAQMGHKASFRLVYSEADYLPGLVIDYYQTVNTQIFSCQILTAGMQNALKNLAAILENVTKQAEQSGLSRFGWSQTAVILRNDVNIRKLEGLDVEAGKILKDVPGQNWAAAPVEIQSQYDDQKIVLQTNFLEGQKTGLFLDQSHNIEILISLLKRSKLQKLRILDLCCYVGQWSCQLAHFAKQTGIEVEVTALDASQDALDAAAANLAPLGVASKLIKGDVLEDTKQLPSRSFEVIISDPPAFIKNKREIPQGKHGYLKLNTEAFRLAAKNSFVASCSCSGLLSEEEFSQTLAKSLRRSERQGALILRGGHASDHPVLAQFPEGHYLKMFVHWLR